MERDRVIDFLIGLNNDLDDVRGIIASMLLRRPLL